jgi:hypothetical protein
MLCGGQGKSMKEEELAAPPTVSWPKIAISLLDLLAAWFMRNRLFTRAQKDTPAI